MTRDAYGYIDYSNPQTMNLYSYCDNDPVNKVDPTGQVAVVDDAIEAGLVAAFFVALSAAAYLGSDSADQLREQIVSAVSASIESLKEKGKNIGGPEGEQYSLRATVSGNYQNVRGGTVYLNAGDVWKYGQTTNPGGRYSETSLRDNNLKYFPEYYGNQYLIRAVEKEKILGYFITNGTLPPGNKIFR